MKSALPDPGDDRVALGHLLLDGKAGGSPAFEDGRHRALEVLAGRTLAGHQTAVDEVGAEKLVYDIEVPSDELLQEAANEGFVLLYRHRRSPPLANRRFPRGQQHENDATWWGQAHGLEAYSPDGAEGAFSN